MPVNKDVIVWARKRAGLTLEQAAKKFAHIAAWEAGKALPSYPQLENLAEEFKLPVAAFFFPNEPKVPPIRQSFRTLPDEEFDQIPPKIRFLLHKAQALQINLSELTDGRNPAGRLITRDLQFNLNAPIGFLASRVRAYLGIGLAEQEQWADSDAALKAWRDAIQRVGIFVFKDAFRVDGYSGFSLYDNEFPVIYVNNSDTKTRQSFTLFHELAHLLFHTSGIDTQEDRYIPALPAEARRIEVVCNQFAAEFLLPTAAFQNVMQGRDRSRETAELIAEQYHVSRESVYRRFLDQGWVGQAEYEAAAREWAGQKGEGGGGDYYRNQIAYLGRDYIALALQQYHRNRFDEAQLAEYLNVSARNVGTLEEYFSRGGQ